MQTKPILATTQSHAGDGDRPLAPSASGCKVRLALSASAVAVHIERQQKVWVFFYLSPYIVGPSNPTLAFLGRMESKRRKLP